VPQRTAPRRAPLYTVEFIKSRIRQAGQLYATEIYEKQKNFCSLRCSVITLTLKTEAGIFCKMSSTQLIVMMMQKFRKDVSIITECPSNLQLIKNSETAWIIFFPVVLFNLSMFSHLLLCEIWGCRGAVHEDLSVHGCYIVRASRQGFAMKMKAVTTPNHWYLFNSRRNVAVQFALFSTLRILFFVSISNVSDVVVCSYVAPGRTTTPCFAFKTRTVADFALFVNSMYLLSFCTPWPWR
jgi:hypothetical protein